MAYRHPETAVIDAVLKGWLLMGFSGQKLKVHGVALIEGLYTALVRGGQNTPEAGEDSEERKRHMKWTTRERAKGDRVVCPFPDPRGAP